MMAAKRKMSVRDICVTAVFTALTAVMAQISVPMPLGVPMTMQTFAISLAGMILGARRGFVSILIYVLLGAAGAPVFANASGGLGSALGPSGGFILSFPVMAFIIGLGADRGGLPAAAAGLTAGAAVNFACGMLMYSLVTHSGLYVTFAACALPFIPTSVIKAVMAAVIGVKVRERRLAPAARNAVR